MGDMNGAKCQQFEHVHMETSELMNQSLELLNPRD